MHPEHFEFTHTRDQLPHWPCTQDDCAGTLELVPDSLRSEMNPDAMARQRWPDYTFTQADDSGRYSMVLKCRRCRNRVMGVGRYQHEQPCEIEGDEHITEVFYPEYFVPPILLIAIPPACPPSVRAALAQAFAAYWALPGLAANAIRVALERLMDALDIAPGTLHARIGEFAKLHPGPGAKYLMAAKWVGNAGSHDGVALHSHIRDILEMVEVTLDALYPRDRSALETKASLYIATKGGRMP